MGIEMIAVDLGSVCSLITDGSHFSPKMALSGLPMASVKDLTPFGIDYATCKIIAEEDFHKLVCQGCAPRKDDVLIAKDGNSSLDTVCIHRDDKPVVLLSSVAILRADPQKILPSYLYYFLDNPIERQQLKDNFRSGSAIPRVILKDFKKVPIRVPSIHYQYKIEDILAPIYRKLQLLQQMNKTLEAIAKAIFRSWFVDFDPVRKKAAGELTGLPQEICALFPNSFEHSEMGDIPKGWSVNTLASLCKLNPETWNNQNHPPAIEYLDLSGVKSGEILVTTKYVYDTAPSRARRVLRKGDTIIGTVRPGNRSFAYIYKDGFTGSTGFAVIRSHNLNFTEFIYLASTQDESIEKYAHLADGGAYPAISPELIVSQKIVIPPDELLMIFHNITKSLFDFMSLNCQTLKYYVDLKDGLLPKLIYGELEIPDVNIILEKAT